MKKLSIGKIRGLRQIANSEGVFTICAMDHRGSLQSMIDECPGEVNYEEMVERKLELCSSLAKYAVPWYQKFGMTARELAHISGGWYQEY